MRVTFSCEFRHCRSNVEHSAFKRLQEKVYNSKMIEWKMASFANVKGGEILGFAVVCFVLFFENGVRLKFYKFCFVLLVVGLCFRKRIKIWVQKIHLREKNPLWSAHMLLGGDTFCSFPAFLAHLTLEEVSREQLRMQVQLFPAAPSALCCSCCRPHSATGKHACLVSQLMQLNWKLVRKKKLFSSGISEPAPQTSSLGIQVLSSSLEKKLEGVGWAWGVTQVLLSHSQPERARMVS